MLEPNNIYQGDCLNLMRDIPDKSIDMILADLPYGTTACAWDSIIPLRPLWRHYKRIIKDRGAIVLTGSQPFTSKLVMSNIDWFKYEWIWCKNRVTSVLNAKRMPLQNTEQVLVFSKGITIYNPQNLKHVNKQMIDCSQSSVYGNKKHLSYIQEFTNYPRQRLYFDLPVNTPHPTQKPVALFSYLIRTYTNPGDLVLDNVAGSGTTAIAAIETGRDWLLIEKDTGYYQIARERIEKRLKQPFLFSPVIENVKEKQVQMEMLNG